MYTVSGSSETSSLRTPDADFADNNHLSSSSSRCFRSKVKWNDEKENANASRESSVDTPMVSALSALHVNTPIHSMKESNVNTNKKDNIISNNNIK